jgi:hypothetical protein
VPTSWRPKGDAVVERAMRVVTRAGGTGFPGEVEPDDCCHPERSEGGIPKGSPLRFAQGDNRSIRSTGEPEEPGKRRFASV